MSLHSLIQQHGTIVQILRRVRSLDTAGGTAETSSVVLAGVKAWRQPASSQVRMLYMQRQLVCTYRVYMVGTVDIKEGDVLSGWSSEKHAVLGVQNPSGLGRLTVIDVSG